MGQGTEIRGLIAKGKIETALTTLLDLAISSHILNDIVLLSSRYNNLKKSIRDGVVSFKESTIDENIICKSLIEICDIIDGEMITQVGKSVQLIDCLVIEQFEDIRLFRESWLNQKESEIIDKGTFPIMDVKILNPTEETIFIHGMIVKAQLLNKVQQFKLNFAQEVSWEYMVCLDPNVEEEELHVPFSQVIKPKDVDRFIVVVGHKGKNVKLTEYNIELVFLYNSNLSFESGKRRIKIYGPELLGAEGKESIQNISLK